MQRKRRDVGEDRHYHRWDRNQAQCVSNRLLMTQHQKWSVESVYKQLRGCCVCSVQRISFNRFLYFLLDAIRMLVFDYDSDGEQRCITCFIKSAAKEKKPLNVFPSILLQNRGFECDGLSTIPTYMSIGFQEKPHQKIRTVNMTFKPIQQLFLN